jgi:subtilisin family serine protease
MSRTRLLVPLAALALAGCTAESPELLSPLAPSTASHSLGSIGKGRFILRAGAGGFGSDFENRVAGLGGKVERKHANAGIAVVSELTDADASALAAGSGIAEVEPDMIVRLSQPVATLRTANAALGDVSATSQAVPSRAILYSWQWNMRLIGADKAWAAGKLGSADVRVAILDTGIDYDAYDLAGLVDLTRSRSFIARDDEITAGSFRSRHPVTDYNGHGTNVASQVSSRAFAFAGVTSKTTLMAVKVLDAEGAGYLSEVLNGVLYAADNGADVANMSLGGGFDRKGNMKYVKLITQVFDYAYRKGMVVVVAAGNEGSDLDHNGDFFASYCDASHVICVSAVGAPSVNASPDAPSFFTNYGRRSIDVAAPGGNADAAAGFKPSAWPWGLDIASWVFSLCSKTSLRTDKDGNLIRPVELAGCESGFAINGYIGTSQAAPHVAGLAALLVSQYGHHNPTVVKRYIELTSKDLGPKGPDAFYGNGRIDVEKAVSLTLPTKFAVQR